MVEGDDVDITTSALLVSFALSERVERAYSLDVGVYLANTWQSLIIRSRQQTSLPRQP
jgi:hypothetical protein